MADCLGKLFSGQFLHKIQKMVWPKDAAGVKSSGHDVLFQLSTRRPNLGKSNFMTTRWNKSTSLDMRLGCMGESLAKRILFAGLRLKVTSSVIIVSFFGAFVGEKI